MLKINKALDSLKSLKDILKSIKYNIISYFENIKASKRAYAVIKKIGALGCKINFLQANYIFVGDHHLEILPHGGVFINETHRLSDTFPLMLAIDDNQQLLEDLNILLEGSLNYANTQLLDITKQKIELGIQVHSISLCFAIDKFKNLQEIEQFIVHLKSLLLNGGVIFGFSALPLAGHKHKNNAISYIKQMEQSGIWVNKNYTIDDLEDMFYKHFEDISIAIQNSVFSFRMLNFKTKPNFDEIRITKENAGSKYIEINPRPKDPKENDYRKRY
jgi:hypothetical protein